MRVRASTAAALALVFVATPVAGAAVPGIDVSHWQRRVRWPSVAHAGYRFAFVKASDGRRGNDWAYSVFRNGALAAGLRVGAYHMARPDGSTVAAARVDATAEADHFVDVATVRDADLTPVLDLEHSGGLPPRRLIVWTSAWLSEVQRRIGVRAAIYASPWFWRVAMADTAAFARRGHRLWVARWTRAASPSVPGGNWGNAGWTFWQWTDCSRVPGIRGCVDGDRFNGSSFGPVLVPPAPVLVEPPEITGVPAVGEAVTVSAGSWQATPPPTLAYAWQRCDETAGECASISGATAASYTITAEDAGQTLLAVVTATSRGRSTTARAVGVVVQPR